MAKQILTCARGHSWEHEGSAPFPADLSVLCPRCTFNNERTFPHVPGAAAPGEPADPSAALRPAEVLAGFEVLEELSRGGMGVIYKARQLGLNRVVALKVIAPERLSSADALRRFQREVQAAALLSHPNIVTVFHTDLEGPRPYLAMEYIDGIDLHRLVQRAGPLSPAQACDYVRQAAQGLQHAFEQGLVHRDIKPANLMVTPSPLLSPSRPPRVKILDMGLARVMTASETAGSITQMGEFLGTPDYIAPEQAEDSRRADVRSDLYSLGCTLFYLLTGQAPFPGANLVQKIRRQLTESPPSAAGRRPDVSPALDALVQRLMAKDPADRSQTPQELIDALDNAIRNPAGVPPAAKPAAPAVVAQPTVREVAAHPGGVRALSLSADGQLLFSGGMDEALRLWKADRLLEVNCLSDGVGPVEDVALAPGGKWAASCAVRLFREDMVVQVWDLATGRETRRLQGHDGGVLCVAVAPDGRRLASGGADRTILIWNLDQPAAAPLALKGHTDAVSRVVFRPGGDLLLSAGGEGAVRLWDSRTGASKGSLDGQVGKVLGAAFGSPGKRIAIAGDGLRVRQADGSLTVLRGHRRLVLCVAFSPDGQRLLSGGADGTVRLWRAEDGEELACFEAHAGKVRALAFHPQGQVAFTGGEDGVIRRWDLGNVRSRER